jgi:hypothetical protein
MKHILANRNITLVTEDGTTINPNEARRLGDEARRNRLAILEGALAVENLLAKVIGHFFFNNDHEKIATLDEMILNSDWCSFAAKRKLLNHVINKENLLQGSEKEKVDKGLREVMSLRNAFAHGRLSTNGNTVWLSYFEGTSKKRELTDQYLTEIESKLQSAWESCLALAQKTGAVKSVEAV